MLLHGIELVRPCFTKVVGQKNRKKRNLSIQDPEIIHCLHQTQSQNITKSSKQNRIIRQPQSCLNIHSLKYEYSKLRDSKWHSFPTTVAMKSIIKFPSLNSPFKIQHEHLKICHFTANLRKQKVKKKLCDPSQSRVKQALFYKSAWIKKN